MILLDRLRPPGPFDPTASAYKDWLHLNIVDPRSGIVGVVNASLHGPSTDERSRVVGTALFHVPDVGWIGNLAVHGHDAARLGHASIALREVALAVDHANGRVEAAARFGGEGLRIQVRATAETSAFAVEWPLPLGSGWVSWYAVPRLRVDGTLEVDGAVIDLANAIGYHDHNWGRWRWGDDLGWDWATFLATDAAVAVAVARTTDCHRTRVDAPVVLLDVPEHRRLFVARTVSMTFDGQARVPLRRLPGAMAALHQDRARPHLPQRVRLHADDGVDRVDVVFRCRAAAQLVTADPIERGTSFIHELSGEFSGEVVVDGTTVPVSGLGIVERVD